MGAITAIFALAIAFIAYGSGPLYFASERKKVIRKLHYWIFCALYDAVIFIILQLITGNSISLSGLAVTMLLFGTIFYFIGLAILRKSGMVAGCSIHRSAAPSGGGSVQPPTKGAALCPSVYHRNLVHLPLLRLPHSHWRGLFLWLSPASRRASTSTCQEAPFFHRHCRSSHCFDVFRVL